MFNRLLFVSFASGVAFGQSNQASISGVVSDAQGAPITELGTDVPISAVTNPVGFYPIPNRPVGA
jgi:hypothetical protein